VIMLERSSLRIFQVTVLVPERCSVLSSKSCHRALVRNLRSASIFEMHLSPSHKLSEAQSPDRAATDQFSAAAYYVRPSLFKSSLFGPPSHFVSLPMYSPA
jgi:hypothetical protein